MTSDRQAADHYEDPANREPTGTPRRRTHSTGRMTAHVAVRFPSATIQKIKLLADEDGKSVSGWIRSAIDAELTRRLPSHPSTEGVVSHLTVVSQGGVSFPTEISTSGTMVGDIESDPSLEVSA